MNYPLISEYIESIKSAEDNFDKLKDLRPIYNGEQPVMSSGNFAVVFKMKNEKNGKIHAVKCFLKDQEGREESYKLITDNLEYVSSNYITPVKYLEKELFVDSANSTEEEVPVLLMDWVEGETLDKYVHNHIGDANALNILAYQFCKLASWLMAQDFAHGDLKPDNILVQEDGSLVLVDYDGMYVPDMKGQKSRELGSPDFRHPMRTEVQFDEHIDDFSLASIALQLKIIALHPELLSKYGAADRLLLSDNDYRDISKCQLLKDIFPSTDAELNQLYGLFLIALTRQDLSLVSFRLLNIEKPKIIEGITKRKKKVEKKEKEEELWSTEVTKEDLADAWTDEHGAKYSKDKKKLLEGSNINDYSIKEGTKVICDKAFSGCWYLTTVTIPNSVTNIGNNPFDGSGIHHLINQSPFFEVEDDILYSKDKKTLIACCSSASSVTIPNSVTNIGDNPFFSSRIHHLINQSPFFEVEDDILYSKDKKTLIACCSSASSVTIPNSVTNIGAWAFSRCEALTTVIIPNSVTNIGAWAFKGCRNLTSVTIPNSVTNIGASAFSGCSNLTSVTIPNSVTNIGAWAFSRCEALTTVTIPNSVTNIVNNPFVFSGIHHLINQSPFFEVEDDILYSKDKKTLIACCSSASSVTIPNSVTNIGAWAFSGCEALTTVTIPNSVTNIGASAFKGCSNLTSVTIPNSVTNIGASAFKECSNLTSVTIPNSVTNIGDLAFFWCYALTTVTIPNSVTNIGASAFFLCKNLTTVTIPNSVTNIGDRAFWRCESLTSVTIPNSVTNIGNNPFVGSGIHHLINQSPFFEVEDDILYTKDKKTLIACCSSASSVTIPNSVTNIGASAFFLCKNLTTVTIPNSVTNIGASAFKECRNLTTVTIPNSVTNIGASAFSECKNLTSVTIPNSVTNIGDLAFSGCSNLTSVSIPNSVTNIGCIAFYGCESLTSVFIPVGTKEKFKKWFYEDDLIEKA